VAGAETMQRMKEDGLARFVPASLDVSFLPHGWKIIDDPSFRVVANPEISVPEAYDKLVMDQLLAVARAMGVSHKRVAKLRGRRWGESGPGKNIATQTAGPISVIAHEIGHQIGDNYGLYRHMLAGDHITGRTFQSGKKKGQPVQKDVVKNRAAIRKEMRALADLRYEQQDVTEGFKKYTRKRQEKEAVILEAWLAAPEKMAQVAPAVTAAWKSFLEGNETLRPLLMLDRSVVIGTSASVHKLPGVHDLGSWAVPAEVATIINNQLAPGIRSSDNFAIRGTYNVLRHVGNSMNQASLSLSGFHALNVSSDAISSHIALGMQQLSRGQFGDAMKQFGGSFGAPITDLVAGDALIKAMRTPIDQIEDPQLRQLVETVIKAGGRASMDPLYHNHAIKGMMKTLRDIKTGNAVEATIGTAKLVPQSIFSALELTAKPIMEMQVPRLKLGVFAMFARDVYQQAELKGWTDAQIQLELASAWDNVDNRMGQLAYDNLHWHKGLKDAMMLAVRSVGWNLGSIREFGGAAIETVNVKGYINRKKAGQDLITRKQAYAVSSMFSYAVQGMVLMRLLSGEWPWEDEEAEGTFDMTKNYYFPKTGRRNPDGSPERLSMPHYSKDWVAWTTRPEKTIKHKLNPIWSTAADLIENEDYFGTEVWSPDAPLPMQVVQMAAHVSQAFIPFSARNFIRMKDAGEDTGMAAIMSLSGIASAPGYLAKSKAQLTMETALFEGVDFGTRTKAEREKSQLRKQTIRDLRDGTDVDMSPWTESEKKRILADAGRAVFQNQFRRLSFPDAVKVFAVGSQRERDEVFETLLKKRKLAETQPTEVMDMFYALKLNHGQTEELHAADTQHIRNLSWKLGDPDTSDARRREVLAEMRRNPMYDEDIRFVAQAFRHRWLFNSEGKRTGRKVTGSVAYRKRLLRVGQFLLSEGVPDSLSK